MIRKFLFLNLLIAFALEAVYGKILLAVKYSGFREGLLLAGRQGMF
jgi:hypothetical protein